MNIAGKGQTPSPGLAAAPVLRRLKRIPGLGLILVILKNLLSIIADSVVKKIENIGINQEMLD